MGLAFSKLQNNSCFFLYYSMMMLQLQAKFSVALNLSNPFIYSSCIEILMFISNISFRFNVWQQQVDITNNTYHNFWIHHDNIQISYMYYKTISNISTLVRCFLYWNFEKESWILLSLFFSGAKQAKIVGRHCIVRKLHYFCVLVDCVYWRLKRKRKIYL